MSKEKLTGEIMKLRDERQAIILAHNYQRGEVQDIADFVGDSLELSRKAAETNAEVIVFCGVHFMAETASILCPNKVILLPDEDAGCPMANMITAKQLCKRKQQLPESTVVCYVNSSAEVKAESYICCTSANAVKVVQSLDSESILFVPDKYLAHYVSTHTDKKIIFWPGYCPTHARIAAKHIVELKKQYPKAVAIVHPECRPDVIAVADEVLSTGGMFQYANREDVSQLILGTEIGIIHRLKKHYPGKQFIPASSKAVCPNMKSITLNKVLLSLQQMSPQVKVPEDIRLKAEAAVDRMLN